METETQCVTYQSIEGLRKEPNKFHIYETE